MIKTGGKQTETNSFHFFDHSQNKVNYLCLTTFQKLFDNRFSVNHVPTEEFFVLKKLYLIDRKKVIYPCHDTAMIYKVLSGAILLLQKKCSQNLEEKL